ncbi:hypothetical protein M9Y10_035929 [Tritrichomonas musculus]|uniref:Uncharacterized protein n=1 Tax=Tritrichomonas musculus TaxID=1915356 RepID=A0ABR2GVN3_9EUKA
MEKISYSTLNYIQYLLNLLYLIFYVFLIFISIFSQSPKGAWCTTITVSEVESPKIQPNRAERSEHGLLENVNYTFQNRALQLFLINN